MNSTKQLIATTERTNIFVMTLADAPFLMDLLRTPGWIKYIGKRDIEDVTAAENYMKNGFLKIQNDYGFGYYIVKKQSGENLGIAGFLKKEELEYEDFGFAFMPQWHGQGYALEASLAILEYGCKQLGLTTIDAITVLENLPSQSLLLKLGFQNYGVVNYDEDLLLFRAQLKV